MGNKAGLLDQQELTLGRLLELSDLMLKGALEEQWKSVRELQLLRDGLIRDFFLNKIEIDSLSVSEGIKYMIDGDQKLAKLGIKQRNLLQEQIYKMKQGKSAVKAYTA